MPSARNMKELENMLKKEMRKAMTVTASKVEADMYEETAGFYTAKKKPKMYERTGALGDTPKTTAIKSSGNTMSFEAYLDDNHQYSTGSKPMMSDVLYVANDHALAGQYNLNPPVGRQGFWNRAEKKMEATYKRAMRKFFTLSYKKK